MADDLGSIDVSNLDALAKIEADQRAIRALAEKAAWHRDKVVEVYARVVRDYEARVKALDEQAQAIRRRVRDDLKTLDALHERSREAVDQARVELQESEFRHEVGEFSRDEFQKRQQEIERTIAARQEEFESVEKLRRRYLDLLPPETAARPEAASWPPAPPAAVPPPAVPAPPKPEPPPPAVPPPPPPRPAGDAARGGAVAAAPVEEPPPPPEAATSFLPPPSSADFRVPAAPGGDDSEQFGTVAVSAAMLVEDKAGLPGVAHRLGLRTSIGRTPDNQIVVPVREVSRRHAEVVCSELGYLLKDLGSPNGTFVNGERVSERRLQDGDRIAMGGQVFVFKAR